MKHFGRSSRAWAACLLLFGIIKVFADEPLVVHEWGTITTHHLPDGTPQGQLNRILESEVLPPFVHKFEPAPTRGDPALELGKSPLVPGRPDVIMRLETPVIYFHIPKGSDFRGPFDVEVKFRGGVLNEFYPGADAAVDVDLERINTKLQAGVIKQWDGKVLDNFVVGSLVWKSLRLADSVSAPDTSSQTWLAPRRVSSAGVLASTGEGEKYLFYRGVAHLDALVQTELTPAEILFKAPKHLHWLKGPSMTVPKLWVADFREGGVVAWREQSGVLIAKGNPSGIVSRFPIFTEKDYASKNLDPLRGSMKRSLIAEGLHEDEAEAMLDTWKESYFETPGLRAFYIVPREWIDTYLPLSVSVPHESTRVLVGRIDLLQP